MRWSVDYTGRAALLVALATLLASCGGGGSGGQPQPPAPPPPPPDGGESQRLDVDANQRIQVTYPDSWSID